MLRVFSLMSIIVLGCSVFINLSSAQKQEDSKPRINIDVNKEYDEKGNIIMYDSSYSYSRSWKGNNTGPDSAFERLHRHLELYNFDDGHFFPHSYILPEFPNFDIEQFFRHADSSFLWYDNLDTILKRNFHDDFLNWNFQPFGPCDSLDFWYSPFKEKFPDSYFDDFEKHLEEMRKYFERNYGSSPFKDDELYPRDLKDKHRNKPRKNTISVNT